MHESLSTIEHAHAREQHHGQGDAPDVAADGDPEQCTRDHRRESQPEHASVAESVGQASPEDEGRNRSQGGKTGRDQGDVLAETEPKEVDDTESAA